MALAAQARKTFTDCLLGGLVALAEAVRESTGPLLSQRVAPEEVQPRRRAVDEYQRLGSAWLSTLSAAFRSAEGGNQVLGRPGDVSGPGSRSGPLSLVDDETIDREIVGSRLALAIMDRAANEFTDLRARMAFLERREDLETHDILRAHVVARLAVDAWRQSGLDLEAWRVLQDVLGDDQRVSVVAVSFPGDDGVVSRLAAAFGIDEATARRVVEAAPCVVKDGITRSQALPFIRALWRIGAGVTVRPSGSPLLSARRWPNGT